MVTPIKAWRQWRIQTVWSWRTWRREPRLESSTRRFRWATGGTPSTATCGTCGGWDEEWTRLVGTLVPGERCSCGLYALKRPDTGFDGDGHVLGQVHLWGKIIEGESGYRAQFGVPIRLFLHRMLWRHRHALARIYRVEVLPMPLVDRFLAPASLVEIEPRIPSR